MTDIMIDPNARVANDETYAGFEDVVGDFPAEGSTVIVREPESDLMGHGIVTRVDTADRLIYIAVDWATVAPAPIMTPDQLVQSVSVALRTLAAGLMTTNTVSSPAQPGTLVVPTRNGALTAA